MNNSLELRNLTKCFGKRIVLDKVSFTFQSQCYGILGSNGAGKTTLLRCITQHYKEGKKAVYYNGKIVEKSEVSIAYLPQNFNLFPELSVKDALLFLCSLRKMEKSLSLERISYALKMVNLDERRNDLVQSLSGGMLRRLGLAQTLMTNPDVILFDEPTAGLDPEERLRFQSLISQIKKDRLILLSSHLVEDISTCCDQIIIMAKQNIVSSGSEKALIQKVDGKVYCISEAQKHRIVGKYLICKTYQEDNVPMLRILAMEKQDFMPVPSTLEDAYLFFSHA